MNNACFSLRRNKISQKQITHEKDSAQGYPVFSVSENSDNCWADGDNVDCHLGVMHELNGKQIMISNLVRKNKEGVECVFPEDFRRYEPRNG